VLAGRIPNANRYLGAPPDWKPEADGHCSHLAILDQQPECGGSNRMWSAWEPTPDELERLQSGAAVYLCVLGTAHPPVTLMVGEAPEGLTSSEPEPAACS